MFASSCSWLQNSPHSLPFDFKFPFSSSASSGDAVPLSGSTRPCLTSLPPSFSLQSAPLHSFFPVCICISIETHTAHVLTMCCCSLLPVHSLLPLFLTHFSVMHPFSVLHSCCKMTPPPSSHTRAIPCICFLSCWLDFFFLPHTVMVLVGLYALAGHGVAKAAHMYYWAPVFIGWYGQTLWCCKGYCPEVPNQRLLLCGQACITYIHLHTVHRRTHRWNIIP